MLIKFGFSSKTGILVVKFAFATANLKIETLRMRRRFARVLHRDIGTILTLFLSEIIPTLPLPCVQRLLLDNMQIRDAERSKMAAYL